jgi:hypothetical protein
MKYYSGRFRPKNIDKYAGDYTKIKYRSMWERQVFKWCDEKPHVIKWNSEEEVIPYRCKTDGKMHRYFMDLKVTFNNGDTYLIEIKPKAQTKEPKVRSRKTKKYIREVTTYAKNISKWEAAEKWCDKKGYRFAIWTEDTIKKLGIKLLT